MTTARLLDDIGNEYIGACTDVTGFGLLGHLVEMCEGADVSTELWQSKVPLLPNIQTYLDQKSTPGGTTRNWHSYGQKIQGVKNDDWKILADPQTSGGLLVSVDKENTSEFEKVATEAGLALQPIGEIVAQSTHVVTVI